MESIWDIPYDPNAQRVNGTLCAAATDPSGVSLLRVNGNNGFGPYARYSLGGMVLASEDEGTGSEANSVALVQRALGSAELDLVAAGSGGTELSRVRRIAGDTLATIWTEYAANGAVTPAPPSQPFALHDPITVDVDGDGSEEVVFGSDDGRLYALRASDGAIVFSLDLGAPVAHVIAADVDLDPQVELEASLADGRLVVIDGAGNYRAVRDPSPGADAGADGGSAALDGAATDSSAAIDGAPGNDGAAASDASVLGSGPPTSDGGPICTVIPEAPYEPHRASCECRSTSGSSTGRSGLLSAVALLGIMLARRREGAP
jgi:hypothetical protein